MIQQAVDVCGVDQEFCIATDDDGVLGGVVEVLPSPGIEAVRSENQIDETERNREEEQEINGHCYTPANCMKEGESRESLLKGKDLYN